MTDYFSEYSSFVGKQGLPSPADTPYETPTYIRSKRSSRATVASSRDQSASPPPLPPSTADFQDGSQDGRYSALDPRRFTPTLHASLVSEILNLRRELDSKNNLVDNLETSLSAARTENEGLAEQLSGHAKDARKAKQQVHQMEQGTYDVVEQLVKERDAAVQSSEDLKEKLEVERKKTRRQDEDNSRTQAIWDGDKESWENERRQMERRIHVTETRLRGLVDEMSAQQAAIDSQVVNIEDTGNDSSFKDSGIGNESDTASIKSIPTPKRHRRNMSSISYRTQSIRQSTSTRGSMMGTPDLYARQNGNSLADELGIDEEDEYDEDDLAHADEEYSYPSPRRRTTEAKHGFVDGDVDAKAKRVLGLTSDASDSQAGATAATANANATSSSHESPVPQTTSQQSHASQLEAEPAVATWNSAPKVHYVDSGYQPSPPSSPRSKRTSAEATQTPRTGEVVSSDHPPKHVVEPARHALDVASRVAGSPISPPDTPVIDEENWSENKHIPSNAPAYSDASAQTDFAEPARPKSSHSPKRDSLSPPMFVPSIAIHPPSSRPSSPRPYVLPPGTKNASTQASLSGPGRDASVQTEPIRVDTRLRRLPSHLLPSRTAPKESPPLRQAPALLPSPKFPEFPMSKHAGPAPAPNVFTKAPALFSTQPPLAQTPIDSSPDNVPEYQLRRAPNPRNMPLRAIPLPRPILAPVSAPQAPPQPRGQQKGQNDNGPLNRSSQYGVTRPSQGNSQLLDIGQDSDHSEYEDPVSDVDSQDLAGSIPAFNRAPHGRFGLSEPPKMVPEDKEISPERRPDTADSYGAAPAPSVASSRAVSQRAGPSRPPGSLGSLREGAKAHSRSPSFGSMASSSYSAQSAVPPFPIPRRSSSMFPPPTPSEGSQSPTAHLSNGDVFGRGGHRSSQSSYRRSSSLRKVQSATIVRQTRTRTTPPKSRRRRRRSPDLTPVQSMAFDTPGGTSFPIPEIPTPLLQERKSFDLVKGSAEITYRPDTAAVSERRSSSQTGLVDAIAATMVGEWMWKYIRKRKSFGIGEETYEYQRNGVTGAVNHVAHGTRHKRWVWLSPYERTIMWDSKQPTSGTALLGKKGRKLTIQSVMDVVDDTPMPRNAELESAWGRSILILTPQRALKFTAINEQRHNTWMTALGFLAQAGRLPPQLPSGPARQPPPIPTAESMPHKRTRSPSFGRATLRDSVRLAKGKRPSYHPARPDQSLRRDSSVIGTEADDAAQDPGADFPAIPRLYISTAKHQRKRSNTSPRLPPPLHNLRSFSSSAVPSSASSRLHPGSTNGSNSSRRDSVPSPEQQNFFEAVGTVRMEAFVDPNVRDGVLYLPAPPPPASAPYLPRRRRGDSIMSASTADRRRTGYVFDDDGMDPFKGF